MKELFQTKTNITYEEYRKLAKNFPFVFYKRIIIFSILMILFSLTSLTESDTTIFVILFMDIVFIGFATFIFKIIDRVSLYFKYNKLLKNKLSDLDYTVTFYDSYLEMKSEHCTLKIKYENISKIKETDDNIYLAINKNIVIVLIKANCSQELIEYIHTIDIKNDSKSVYKVSEVEQFKVSKMRGFLIFLFILSIASLWLGLGTCAILCKMSNLPYYLWSKYMCGMWFWLPVPILSIILGFKYNKRGIKCKKNIIGGFIIAALLLLYGSFSFLFDFNFEVDYSEIYHYESIIGIKVPTQGTFIRQEWEQSYLLDHTTNYAWFKNSKENNEFLENIQKSNNWILESEISSNLGIFIPANMSCPSDSVCYYSVYIEGMENYNTIPSETGKYHIYSMMYHPKKAVLQIEDYFYYYKS